MPDNPVLLAVGALVLVAGGALLGFVARGLWAAQAVRAAQDKAGRIVAEARAQQKDLILQAKEEQVRLQRETSEEERTKRAELAVLEHRLLQRDEQLDQRTDMLEQRDRKLLERERELQEHRDALSRARQEQVTALERVSGMTAGKPRRICSRKCARRPSMTPSASPARSSGRPAMKPRTAPARSW